MFSISLPLNRHKYRAGLTQAKTEQSSAEEMKRSMLFELEAELAKTAFSIKDSLRRVRLFRDTLIPKAEESLESTYTAFEAGKASFLDLLDAERALLDFQLSQVRAQADLRISDASFSALLGDYSELELETGKGARS